MAIGGENIGRAYVKVIADGSGFGDGLKKDIDDLGDDFEKGGREHGKRYENAQTKQLRKGLKEWAKEYETEMSRASAKVASRTREIMKGSYLPEIERRLIDDWGDDVGGLLARRMKERFTVEGAGMFENYFADLPRAVADAEREVLREREKSLNAQQRLEEQAQRDRLRRSLERVAADRAKWAALDRDEEEAYKERAQRERAAEAKTMESIKRLQAAYDRIGRGQANSGESYRISLEKTEKHLKEIRESLESMPNFGGRGRDTLDASLVDMERSLVRISPRLRVFNGTLDDIAPRIGRAFGRGSRNDFVNFFGSMTENLSRMAFAVPKAAEGLVGLVRNFSSLAAAGGEGGLGGILAKTGPRLLALAPAFAAGAAGAGVLVVVLGTVISAVSLLLGVIVALAGTIYASAITAIAALGGALLPVAAGVGVLAGAIASMSDEQKKAAKEAIQPFVKGMKEIGRSAADAIFGGERFTKTIKDMTAGLASSEMGTLVTEIADAIGDVGASWAKSLNSDGFREWLETMSRTVPDQLRGLGEAAKNTFAGLGGIFVGIQPLVTDFVNWLERITGEFAEWANTDAGRQAIVDFFERGANSAKALGGFLKEAGGFLQDLLFAGQSTGDDLFSSMAENIKKFRDYLKENPEALEQWFEDAKKFGEALGDVVVAAGKVADAFDSPAFRTVATGAFQGIVTVLEGVGVALDAVKFGFELLTLPIRGFIALVTDGVGGAMKVVLDTVATALDAIGGLGSLLGKIPGVPDGLGQSAKDAADKLRGLGESMVDTKAKSDELNNARANPRTSDGGSNDAVKGKIQGAMTALSKLGDTIAKPKTTDSGTNDAVKGKVNALDKALKAISGVTKTTVQGSIFPSSFLSTLRNLGSALNNVAGTRTASVRGNLPLTAVGGIFSGAQPRIIAEAGREAVVPLDRDPSQVDPSVRMLAAIAQGKVGYGAPGAMGKSISIAEGAVQVITPSESPAAVAREVLDEIVGGLL